MASTEHTPLMNPLDSVTVSLYRTGLTLATLSSVLYALELIFSVPLLGVWYLPILVIGVGLSSANIHLYDPRFRWLIPMMSWLSMMVVAISLGVHRESILYPYILWVAKGFSYAGLGMFALKEHHCFKTPGLPATPWLFIAALGCNLFSFTLGEGIILGLTTLIFIRLCVSKWRMPLHFDIGDKSLYTV